MKKNKFFILIILTVFFVSAVKAQESETDEKDKLKRYEIGGHFTYLKRSDANTVSEVWIQGGLPRGSYPHNVNELGIGLRFTYNISTFAAVEAEGNLFPEDKKANYIVGVPIYVKEPGGRKMQALVGPKIGYRGDKFGVFGKAKVGIIRFDRYEVVNEVGPPGSMYIVSELWENPGFFNTDIGGVFEYYPSKNTVFRVDVSDSIIHYHKFPPKDINPSMTRHNLQTSIGFGFRF